MLNFRNFKLVSLPISHRFFSSEPKLSALNYDQKSRIATLTLNRPPVNGLNLELLQEINNSVVTADKDDNCRGLIITSSNSNIFSAGLDILEMYKPNTDRAKAFWTALQDTWLTLYNSSTPTAALINGHSPAGGCLLATSCEYRVMLPNYTIGLNETKLGIVAPKWFMASMLSVVPRAIAERSLTQGKMFTTDEALCVGLVDEVANNNQDAEECCSKFFSTFDSVDRFARTITKRQMRAEDSETLSTNREADLANFLTQISEPIIQKKLGLYLQSLARKSIKERNN